MANKQWITEGFDAFRRGTFGNAGQNLYVSKKGILQRIFQYDLNQDGYVDLVYANCQNHGESAPSYVYTLDGQQASLPGQGSICGMVLDIDGDGYQDIVVAGNYDMAIPYASSDIYFGSPEGYSEKYHTRIPTPFSADCCHGDFNGKGKPILAFALTRLQCIRLFEQTKNNCLEWKGYTDFPIVFPGDAPCSDPCLITAADLDGDGYDDLVLRRRGATKTVIYWGGPDGLQSHRYTVLPEFPASEIQEVSAEITQESDMEHRFRTPRLLETVRWNGRNCFTLSTGKKMIFFSSNADRQLERVLEIEVPLAQAVAVGDIDGDGYDDIAIATYSILADQSSQCSFILWNGPEGLDSRPRTVVNTLSACQVSILDKHVLFCQCNTGRMYTNDSLLFTYPDFENPQRFEGEDSQRGSLIRNPDGVLRVYLNNHYSRCAIGYDKTYIYWGSPEGYSPDRMQAVPSHCAVDAMIIDFNDDGWAELLVGNNSENSMHLDPGHHVHYFGPNGFEPERSHTMKTNVGWGLAAGDFNRDGYLEVISAGGTEKGAYRQLRMFSAKDNFATYQVIDLPEGATGRWIKTVDINCDGWLDLIVPNSRGYNPIIFWGGPEGFSLERSQELGVYFSCGCAAADLTKNGYPDVIIGSHSETWGPADSPHNSFIHIYWNGPEGIKESRKTILRAESADHMAIADFNGDGWLDLFACSYHGGKDRDISSYLYWNREGNFREVDKQRLFTHSASGCMAADFNEDGYIDLAVANHKVEGDHHGYSSVWWNGPKGFNEERTTDLPTNGPHGMISTEMGNIMDRSYSEYYYSEAFTVDSDCTVAKAFVDGDVPAKTAVHITARVNGGQWDKAEGLSLKSGDVLEYRLEFYAYNCLRTPRIEKVTIEFAPQ